MKSVHLQVQKHVLYVFSAWERGMNRLHVETIYAYLVLSYVAHLGGGGGGGVMCTCTLVPTLCHWE